MIPEAKNLDFLESVVIFPKILMGNEILGDDLK